MAATRTPVVRFAETTKRYGSLTALDRLTLDVHEGEIVGLLGPNGAGKTTALRTLLGLLKADGGRGRGVRARRLAEPCRGTPAPGLHPR